MRKRPVTLTRKTRPSIWRPPLRQLHVIPDDARFEDCGAAIPHGVTQIDETTTDKPRTRAIDKKMQYEWREDLLPEEKRARLQEKTDRLLGKTNVALDASAVVPAENSVILPPHVLQEPRRPAGSDPYETHEPRDSFKPREWIPWDTTPLDTLVTNDEVTSHMPLATEVDLRDNPC
jgi:hypothetical protein